ncbi:MAG: hypothetical protein LBR17_04130 [Bacteroidales bacterium]|jgi:hypothetical protein|nr:hypothetical protein [Bacteroidales bacterium]
MKRTFIVLGTTVLMSLGLLISCGDDEQEIKNTSIAEISKAEVGGGVKFVFRIARSKYNCTKGFGLCFLRVEPWMPHVNLESGEKTCDLFYDADANTISDFTYELENIDYGTNELSTFYVDTDVFFNFTFDGKEIYAVIRAGEYPTSMRMVTIPVEIIEVI